MHICGLRAMKFHAVRIIPSERRTNTDSLTAIANGARRVRTSANTLATHLRCATAQWGMAVLIATATSIASMGASAETLGRVTDVDSANGEIVIDGQLFQIASGESARLTADGVATSNADLSSLKVGDFILFSEKSGQITSLRRPQPGSMDLPAGSPIEPANVSPRER